MDRIAKIVMFVFIGALVVLVITHASGFSTAVSSVGGQVTNDASLLAGYQPTGSGFVVANGAPNSGGQLG